MKTDYTPGVLRIHTDPQDCHRHSLLVDDQWGAVHVAGVSIINTTPTATDANAERITATWNACIGLDLPDNVPPGTLTHAAKLLAKWHSWATSGRLADLRQWKTEAGAVLRALGLPAMDQAPVSNLNPERQ